MARIRALVETTAAMITDSGSEIVSEPTVVLVDWRLVDTVVMISEPVSAIIVKSIILLTCPNH